MRVLGVDPGTRLCGWGIVDRIGTRLTHVAHGVIRTDESEALSARLVQIERELVEVVTKYQPQHAGIEGLFFAKNASSAAKLGHARGVVLLVCARAGLAIAEYAPAQVKRTVAGGGRADKNQVAQMIRVILSLVAPPPSDAADALAVAVTHLQSMPFSSTGIAAVITSRRKAV